MASISSKKSPATDAAKGVYHGRLVSYDNALPTVCDLLDLIEVWMAAQPRPHRHHDHFAVN
jgi:hypothetical protein